MMQRAMWKGADRPCDGGGQLVNHCFYAVDPRIMPVREIDLVVIPDGGKSVHFFYESEENMRKEWAFWID